MTGNRHMSEQKQVRIGFVGSGQMATALARGLISSAFTSAANILASDVHPAARERFQAATGARATDSSADVISGSDVIVIAVKPQHLKSVLDSAQPLLEPRHLVISIAAGVPLSFYETKLGRDCRIIRVMPNTPCLVGATAAGFSLGAAATQGDAALVQELLETVGVAVQVEEGLLDAVTGLSGSGPAYVYQIIEAFSDGGVRMGLPREIATRLAAQTVLGAARMVLETGQHPGQLKDAVTSPGGTTIAGLHALERGGLRAALMNAVEAATLRSRELGR